MNTSTDTDIDIIEENKVLIKALSLLQDNLDTLIEAETNKKTTNLQEQISNLNNIINELGLENNRLQENNDHLLKQLISLSKKCIHSYKVLEEQFIIEGPHNAMTPLIGMESLKHHGFLPFMSIAEKVLENTEQEPDISLI